MKTITSLGNPVVKSLRGLHERKSRRRSGLFLAEGTRIVTEALALGWQPRHLVFLAGREEDPILAPLLKRAAALGAELVAVNAAVLGKISRKDNPQMLLGSFAERYAEPEKLAKAGGCLIGLDRVRDPGNLGTIMRTADAIGADGLILIGETTDPFSVEAVRASMGAVFNCPLAAMDESGFITWCRQRWHGRIIATTLQQATDYRQADWQAPLLVLMGMEQAGLSQPLTEIADQRIRMPMRGRSDSLNLAVASGVVLYEYLRHNKP